MDVGLYIQWNVHIDNIRNILNMILPPSTYFDINASRSHIGRDKHSNESRFEQLESPSLFAEKYINHILTLLIVHQSSNIANRVIIQLIFNQLFIHQTILLSSLR